LRASIDTEKPMRLGKEAGFPDFTNDRVGRQFFGIDGSSGGAPQAALRLAHEQDAVAVIEDDSRDRRKDEKLRAQRRAKTLHV
jgi:hypothetical protein